MGIKVARFGKGISHNEVCTRLGMLSKAGMSWCMLVDSPTD